MGRLRAAALELLRQRKHTLSALEELDERMTQQWYSVNTAQSVSATMAVGSFVALCTVGAPVGAALGLAAAGAGVSATTRDFVRAPRAACSTYCVCPFARPEQLGNPMI